MLRISSFSACLRLYYFQTSYISRIHFAFQLYRIVRADRTFLPKIISSPSSDDLVTRSFGESLHLFDLSYSICVIFSIAISFYMYDAHAF